MPPCQSAYRAGHSTETTLVKVQSDILLNMDHQNLTQLVLIDLLSAFDTVDHDIWLNIKNGSFGVSGTALNWLSSYLQSRSQRIFINGTAPEQFKLDSCLGPIEYTEYSSPVLSVIDQGVPQDSCLGPIEYTEYSSPVLSVIDQHGKLGQLQFYTL